VGTPTRPVRQEAELADPTITEVGPGVLRLQLPIELPGLGHVNCYALEDDRGVALVDPGLPGPKAWKALTGRLAAAGFPLKRVHTVVVTHSHFDHFGGANRLRRETGAEIVTHARFQHWWDVDGDIDLDEVDTAAIIDDGVQLLPHDHPERYPWGGEKQRPPKPPLQVRARLKVRRALTGDAGIAPTPTVKLEDADTISLAGREWVALHTPGHTADHLCLFDPTEGIVLSGDHVLPTITPHISGMAAGPDPLSRFFASLDRMHELEGVTQVLPAHGHPFTDLDGRVESIRGHHLERLDVLRKASAELGPATVTQLMQQLFKPRVWGGMAESETFAHLEHLRRIGQAQRTEEAGELRYLIAPGDRPLR
jgi:glyoxylase-like metal-dependent hydrolase (beta-lactamase superfamily II)